MPWSSIITFPLQNQGACCVVIHHCPIASPLMWKQDIEKRRPSGSWPRLSRLSAEIRLRCVPLVKLVNLGWASRRQVRERAVPLPCSVGLPMTHAHRVTFPSKPSHFPGSLCNYASRVSLGIRVGNQNRHSVRKKKKKGGQGMAYC